MPKWLGCPSKFLLRYVRCIWILDPSCSWHPSRSLFDVLHLQHQAYSLWNLYRTSMDHVPKSFISVEHSQIFCWLSCFVSRKSCICAYEVISFREIQLNWLLTITFIRVVNFCLERVCKWIHAYLDRQVKGEGIAVFKIRAHAAFYAACHIPFYVVAARHHDYLGNKKRKDSLLCEILIRTDLCNLSKQFLPNCRRWI